ncbi:hypothetical protein BKA63DRAFT_588874 [Paraphoma chrysanthemicola]|nr:hypothetical protein BKA63DRAFT_588874 [Paraphoma chrysanthemicola]
MAHERLAENRRRTERLVTLVCNNLAVNGKSRKLDLWEALKSGLIELLESGENNVVALPAPSSQQLRKLKVLPKPSPQHVQVDVGIYTDTRSSEWKDVLRPGQIYQLRLSRCKDEVWAYYTDDFASPDDVPSTHKLAVEREDNTIHFSVRDDPAPPKLFAKLEMPERALTIDKSRSPLSVFEEDLKTLERLIDCRNTETGEEVQWISQDKPWRFECALENLEYDKDTVRSVFGLEAGQTYKARLHGANVFTRWQYGRRAELLMGSVEDKKRRWEIDHNDLGTLYADNIGEPVVFTVVE